MSQTSLRTVPGRIWIRPSMSTPRRCLTWSFPAFHQKAGTGTLGDLGYAVNLDNGKTSAFIVAEVGPSDAKLEMSIALAQALGGQNPNPRTGAGKPDGKIAYVVFPKSRANPAWPDQSTNRRPRPGPAQAVARGMETLKACGADAK